ncbi:MAG: hypothetical protein ACREXX_13125, partial [Gammaproteobacteria bacterium]
GWRLRPEIASQARQLLRCGWDTGMIVAETGRRVMGLRRVEVRGLCGFGPGSMRTRRNTDQWFMNRPAGDGVPACVMCRNERAWLRTWLILQTARRGYCLVEQ